MAELTAETLAAALALLNGAETPVAAPARTSVFAGATRTAVAGTATDSRPAILHGLPLREARVAAAVEALAGYSCSVDAEWTLADGTVKSGAAHGFATPRTPGDPCPSTAVKGGCPGTIRG